MGERTRDALKIALAIAMLGNLPAAAQDAPGATPSLHHLQLNPLAASTKLPLTLNAGLGAGPDHKTETALNIEPTIPFTLNGQWDLITRTSISVGHLPDPVNASGLGDASTSLFFSPAKVGAWDWGVGPILQVPTATNSNLGARKWAAGPTAALVYVDGPWVNGIVASHVWSFAGARNQPGVSQTQVEVQFSYTFASNWYIQTDPTITYDWKASAGNRWTVPLGLDVGKLLSAGSQSLGLQAGAYRNLRMPDGAPNWVLRAQVTWTY